MDFDRAVNSQKPIFAITSLFLHVYHFSPFTRAFEGFTPRIEVTCFGSSKLPRKYKATSINGEDVSELESFLFAAKISNAVALWVNNITCFRINTVDCLGKDSPLATGKGGVHFTIFVENRPKPK